MKSKANSNSFSLKALPPAAKRRMALIGGAGAVTLLLLFLTTDHPQSAPTHRTDQPVKKRISLLPSGPGAPRTLADYSSLMHRNLFRPLVAKPSRTIVAKSHPLLPAGLNGFGTGPLPGDRTPAAVEGWSYIGTVTVDSAPFALVQNASSGDYGYYRVGEKLNGLPIESIGTNELVLAQPGGAPIRLAKTSGAPPAAARGQNVAQNNGGFIPANAPVMADSSAAFANPNAGSPDGAPAAGAVDANASNNFRRRNGGGGRRQRGFGGNGNGGFNPEAGAGNGGGFTPGSDGGAPSVRGVPRPDQA